MCYLQSGDRSGLPQTAHQVNKDTGLYKVHYSPSPRPLQVHLGSFQEGVGKKGKKGKGKKKERTDRKD